MTLVSRLTGNMSACCAVVCGCSNVLLYWILHKFSLSLSLAQWRCSLWLCHTEKVSEQVTRKCPQEHDFYNFQQLSNRRNIHVWNSYRQHASQLFQTTPYDRHSQRQLQFLFGYFKVKGYFTCPIQSMKVHFRLYTDPTFYIWKIR